MEYLTDVDLPMVAQQHKVGVLVGASVLGGLYDPAHGDVKLFDTVFNLLAVVPVDVAGVVQVDDVVKEQVRFVVAQDVNGDLHP